jgi:hypothetical protein
MMKRWIACVAMTLSFGANALPVEVAAEYKVSNSGVAIGRVTENFQRTGDRYSIRSTTRSEGVLKLVLDDNVTFESRGRVNADGLQPLEFEQRRASNSSRDVHATFDWDRGVMSSRFRGETTEVPLPRATQDRISVFYQFMALGRGAGSVDMHMSNGRKIERYTYRFVDEARITTPAGEFDTVHYARVTASDKESRTDVWLAKDRFNIPVRVLFDDPKGLRVEQLLLDLKVR